MRVTPNSLSNSGVSSLAIVIGNGPERPKVFSPADVADLSKLQDRNNVVTRLEGNAVSRRALLLRDQFRFIDKHGVVSVDAYARQRGFAYEAASLVYHVSAQLLLNRDVAAACEAEREAIQNEVSLLARALDELAARAAEHELLSAEQFVAWYKAQGRVSGLAGKYRDRKRTAKPSAASVAGSNVAATSDAQKVDAIFNNPAAVEIDALPGISTGQEGLFMYRQEGGKVRLVPLASTPARMAELAGYAPCFLAAMPADLRFYREMLMTGAAFVPDEMSDIPIADVPDGDFANDSYDMLPAYAMYLVERDRLSIAHARRDDGLILEVVPSFDPGYSMKGECFIDNLTRRRLAERLLGEADAAHFGLAPVDGFAGLLAIAGHTKTLTFTSNADGTSVNLIVKPRRIGAIWTYRVDPAFAPVASAMMSAETVTVFDDTFMKVLLKQQKDRAVTIAVGKKGISFANDKAAAAPFDVEVKGSAKVQVMLHDLRRAMVGLLGLSRNGGLTWRLDPNGLLLIEAATEVATYRVFVQTLEPNREQPTRSRVLRDRVETLSVNDAPATETAAAA